MQNAAEEYSIESKNVEEDTTSNPFLASPKRKMLEDAAFLEDALSFKQTEINENEFENENEENDSEGEGEDDQGGGEREDEQDDEMKEEKEKEGLKLVALTNAHRREIRAAYDRIKCGGVFHQLTIILANHWRSHDKKRVIYSLFPHANLHVRTKG